MSTMDSASITIETFRKIFEAGKRFDGRGLLDFRDLSVEYEVSKHAEGSARVRLGKTEVVVGVKLALDKPYPDSMEKGNLMVSGDFLPLASPRIENGPPKFTAIELPRLVDRAIRESGMIDLKKLVVIPGEKVWTVIIDVYPINDDGNLIDAATIGAVVALKKAIIPGITKNGTVDYKHRTKNKIPLSSETYPLSFSFYKAGNAILMDPTREEEEVCDVRISFALSKMDKKHLINSCQKTGDTTFTRAELEKIADLLNKKYDELNEKLKSYF